MVGYNFCSDEENSVMNSGLLPYFRYLYLEAMWEHKIPYQIPVVLLSKIKGIHPGSVFGSTGHAMLSRKLNCLMKYYPINQYQNIALWHIKRNKNNCILILYRFLY